MVMKLSKSDNGIVIEDAGKNSDVAFLNLIRRLMMTKISFDVFTDVKVMTYNGSLPISMIINRIELLPVRGVGSYSISIDDTDQRNATSNDITGPGKVEPNIPILTLENGQKLKITMSVKTELAENRVGCIPYVAFVQDQDRLVVEHLSSLTTNNDAISDIGSCIDRIRDYCNRLEIAISRS